MSYLKFIIGAAIFDLSGLPKQYFISPESSDVGWVQTLFQALGLQSLLTASMKLEGFRHVIVYGNGCRAIVVKQRSCYVALLICSSQASVLAELIGWAQELEPATLNASLQFTAI